MRRTMEDNKDLSVNFPKTKDTTQIEERDIKTAGV